MRVTLLPPAGANGAAGPFPMSDRLVCPNAGCGGDLHPLDGPDGLFCEACSSVVVLLRDGSAVWHPRNAAPCTITTLALRVPRPASA